MFIREHADVIVPAEPAPWPENDPDDRWIMAAAAVGDADVLATGDKEILAASGAVSFPIVTPRGFWESLRAQSARTPAD